jgi:hypothetical protein
MSSTTQKKIEKRRREGSGSNWEKRLLFCGFKRRVVQCSMFNVPCSWACALSLVYIGGCVGLGASVRELRDGSRPA